MQNQEFETYRLLHSDPNFVFDWLKKNRPRRKKSLIDPDRKVMEESLLNRNEPLINLGLVRDFRDAPKIITFVAFPRRNL